jgi:hypothetical protein
MPLDNTTTRYDLREERDRLDGELDDLAAQSVEHEERFADLQGRAATDDGDSSDGNDEFQRELGQLMEDREELQEKIGRINRQYNGVVWALNRYGSTDHGEVATDGGENAPGTPDSSAENAAPDDDASTNDEELYEQMTADDDDERPTVTAPDQRPQTAASTDHSGSGPAQSADSPTADEDTAPTQPDSRTAGSGSGAAGTGEVTITLGGLTAGEHARVTDRAGDAQAEKSRTVVGGGRQGGSVEGASRVFYCAAGLVDAPFVDRGAGFEEKCEAVREVHPGLMVWMESRIDDVNTPSEELGNGWGDRLRRARNNQPDNSETSPPATSTSKRN